MTFYPTVSGWWLRRPQCWLRFAYFRLRNLYEYGDSSGRL